MKLARGFFQRPATLKDHAVFLVTPIIQSPFASALIVASWSVAWSRPLRLWVVWRHRGWQIRPMTRSGLAFALSKAGGFLALSLLSFVLWFLSPMPEPSLPVFITLGAIFSLMVAVRYPPAEAG